MKRPDDRSGLANAAAVENALLAVLLDAGGAKAGQSVPVDRALPAQIFLNGERVTLAGFFNRKQPAPNGSDDFRLAANDPTLVSGGRKIGNGKRTAIGPDDIVYTWTQLTVHVPNSNATLTHSLRTTLQAAA